MLHTSIPSALVMSSLWSIGAVNDSWGPPTPQPWVIKPCNNGILSYYVTMVFNHCFYHLMQKLIYIWGQTFNSEKIRPYNIWSGQYEVFRSKTTQKSLTFNVLLLFIWVTETRSTLCLRCDMAFIEPMHRNKPNITYLLNTVPADGLALKGARSSADYRFHKFLWVFLILNIFAMIKHICFVIFWPSMVKIIYVYTINVTMHNWCKI